jgi:hypothetical protein
MQKIVVLSCLLAGMVLGIAHAKQKADSRSDCYANCQADRDDCEDACPADDPDKEMKCGLQCRSAWHSCRAGCIRDFPSP